MNGTEEITNQQLNDVFEFVNAHDPTFKERYTREGWEEKIRRDEEYRKETYEWIKNTERILDKKAEKEGKQKGSLYNKVAGTYESFSKSFDPIDVKKKLDSESQDISLKGTTESALETTSSESSENQPSEVVNEFVSTFNEDEFQEWWNTNPNILQWKQDYINSYGTEPVLGEVMMDIPDWYDFRAAYNAGITPQQNVNKKYYWGYDSPTGEVIKISEGAEWKRKFEEDTGESPPEGMSMEEANSTYYNEGSGKYILHGVRGTAINLDTGVQPSAYIGEYGLGIDDKVGREFYAFFQQDGKKLNMTTQEMQKALDAQSLEEWDKLIDYDTMVDIFLQKEEIAAPLLEKMFLDYGFEVGQRHLGNDRIEIIAPNGKSITLSTDQDDKKWYDKSHTHSASHNAKMAINFLNKNKGKRSYVHDTQRYQDAQNIEFRRDWNEHTNEASQFRKNLREYNKLNTTYTNYPRSKRKEDRYIKLKEELPVMREELEKDQSRIIDQDNKLISLQERLNLRAPISEEWVQGEGGFMDFFNDMYQSYQAGQTKGAMTSEVLDVMWQGESIGEKELGTLLRNWEAVKASGMPDELKAYNKEYAEGGGGLLSALTALYHNPSVASYVFAESVGQYLNETTVELGMDTFGAVVMGATAYGSAVGPAGTAGGAVAGVSAGALLAVGMMSGSIETAMTYMELLSEATGGDLSEKAVRKVLSNPSKVQLMRNRALGRGMIIGGFDVLTAGIAGKAFKVTSKLIGKVGAAGTGVLIEGVGGATGEGVAQWAEGEGLDASDILLEGVAGFAGAPVSISIAAFENYMDGKEASPEMKEAGFSSTTKSTSLLPGTYKLNGEPVSSKKMINFVGTGTPQDVAGATISIDGNPRLLDYTKKKRDNAITNYEVSKEIDPLISDPTDRAALIKLETERRKLENNKSQTGKLRLKQIDKEIGGIVEKYDTTSPEKTDIETFFEDESFESRIGKPKTNRELRDKLERTRNSIYSLEKLNVDFENPKNETEQEQADIYNQSKDLENQLVQQISLSSKTPTTPSSRLEVGKKNPVTLNPEGPGTLGIIKVPKSTKGGYDLPMKSRVVVKGKPIGEKVYLIDETVKPGERPSFSNPDPESRRRTINSARKAFKSIKTLAPNVNLLMYETHKKYIEMGNPSDSRGNYSGLTNTIAISLEKISPSTAPHEVIHAFLFNNFETSVGKQLKTKQMIEAVIRVMKKRNTKLKSDFKKAKGDEKGNIQTEINENEEFINRLHNHVAQYEGKATKTKNEEFLAEALGLIATEFHDLPKEAKSKVRQFIEWLLKKLGLGKYINKIFKTAPDDVIVDSLNTIARKMKGGEVMTQEDVKEMELTPEQKKTETEVTAPKQDEIKRYEEAIEKRKREAGGVENMEEDELMILEDLEVQLVGLKKGPSVAPKDLKVEGIEEDVDTSVKDILGVDKIVRKKTTPTYKEPIESGLEPSEQKMDEAPKDETPKKETPKEKTPEGRDAQIVDIIQKARENNFSDSEISDYLVRVKKFKPSEVKKALDIKVDDMTLLPKSFADIKGGAKAGLRLYKKVLKYKDALIERNKTAKTKLTQEQITDKVIEYLEKQPSFIREKGTTKGLSPLQAKMQTELQSTMGMRPTRDMAKALQDSRNLIREVERGVKTLQQFKQHLRNFMRKTLPKDMYTKPEVLKMVRKIEEANRSTIRNLMNEIIEFTNEKMAKSLEADIDKKINAKYEVRLSGRKKATSIDSDAIEQMKVIKKERAPKDSSPEEMYTHNATLAAEYNTLTQELSPTDEQIRRMAALEIAMKLNNARLMENSDINKVRELDDINNSLEQIIVGGRQRLVEELDAARKEYERQLSIAWEDITKEKVDASTEEGKNQIEKTTNYIVSKEDIKKVDNIMKKIFRGIGDSVSNFFVRHEALDGLMDKISLMPGELFGGKLKDLVYERINEGTRLYKGRRMAVYTLVTDKLKSLYGKGWESKMANNKLIKAHDIYKDKKEVLKAKEEYKKNKTALNKQKVKEGVIKNNIQGVTYSSQEQLYYLYNQFKDPANHGAFEKMWGDNYKEIAQQIEDALTPEMKTFADWQVDELFPMLYPHYNKTYRQIYRTNMPQNENYAGTLYREGITPEPLDLLSGKDIYNTTVGASSTMARVYNTNAIQAMDGTDVLVTYITNMEYFAAMAEPIRDINKIFTNPYIKKAIISIHGKTTYTLIQHSIQQIANRGVRTNIWDKAINSMNTVFVLSRLGANPTVMIKQLTSFATYANDIGIRNWVKHSVTNIKQLKSLYKEVMDNSIYLQDRYGQTLLRTIESYRESDMQTLVPTYNKLNKTKNWLVNASMYLIKVGDKGAIILGGLPNYSYYKAQYKKKNPNATEQEVINYAIRKFESDTKRTQQSVDLQDKDVFQVGSPFFRGLNMFKTAIRAYLRKEIVSTRHLWRKIKAADPKASKGTVWQNIRTFLMYHVFLPVLFQFATMGFRVKDDEDWWDLGRAAILGPLNALVIVGDWGLETLFDTIQGKPWAGEDVGNVLGITKIIRELAGIVKDLSNSKTEKTRAKYWKKLILEMSTLTGIPSHQIDKLINNYEKVLTGDTDGFMENLLRLLNYSEHAIYGLDENTKKKKKDKKKKKIDSRTTEGLNIPTIDYQDNTLDDDLNRMEEDFKKKQEEMMLDFNF